jgi:AraC family transcriptional regulator
VVPLSGQRARAHAVPGFRVSETHHAAGALAEHAHAEACFCLVVGGGLAEVRRGRALAMRAGELIVRPAGDEHADRFEPGGATCLNIEHVADGATDHAAPRAFRAFQGGPAVWCATRIRAALLAGDALALEDACWALIGACTPEPDRGPRARPWLAAIERLIASRPTEPWSLAGLAAEARVHPAHLTRAFRRAHGTSVVAAILRARVDAAARQLARDTASLAEIATACGFYDQPHFTRVFRRATGLTPDAYRRAAGSDRTRRRPR